MSWAKRKEKIRQGYSDKGCYCTKGKVAYQKRWQSRKYSKQMLVQAWISCGELLVAKEETQRLRPKHRHEPRARKPLCLDEQRGKSETLRSEVSRKSELQGFAGHLMVESYWNPLSKAWWGEAFNETPPNHTRTFQVKTSVLSQSGLDM